jgi:hypothetical protein
VRHALPAYRLGKLIGICPCCLLSAPSRESRRSPYLRKGRKVFFPNQLCSTNITYIQTGKGTPTLVAVIDQFSRYIVSWKPFDTMCDKEVATCARQAFTKHVTLSIMNLEQRGVFGFYKYVVAARLHACGAEPEQEEPDEGTTPSCKDGSRRSRANACGRRSTAHLQSLRVTIEKLVTRGTARSRFTMRLAAARRHNGTGASSARLHALQWYCPDGGIQKGSGFPYLTGSDTSQNRRHL